ncbi:MAG: AAA family ATPase, partial [Bacteriodetes bacterium]|nr:AAA family ATPase [Bacteroidota bacterium]
VSRLIGAPPGYVGYEEGGQLTEAVRQRPYSVVLFDEIEKAHPDVFNILLQVLDDGRLTDSQGRVVNFTNTIIIMTSNLGTEYIQDKLQNLTEENRDSIMNEARLNIIELLRQRLRPEFLNRIDEIIFFKPLTKTDIRQIVMVQVKKLQAKLKAEDITLTLSNDALDWIANLGYDPQYGARPLKRAIQRYLADPLAIKLLSAEIASGDVINAEVNDIGGIEFNKQ